MSGASWTLEAIPPDLADEIGQTLLRAGNSSGAGRIYRALHADLLARAERVWRCEGLKVPSKAPKRSRLWLNDGSCVWLRPTHRHHVWSRHSVEGRTHDGREYHVLSRRSAQRT